jgi:class 3 adenylate cyclase
MLFSLIKPVREAIAALSGIGRLDVEAMLARISDADIETGGDLHADERVTHCDDSGNVTVEGARLQASANMLALAVLSFARFMPIDVVREMLTTHSLADVNLKYIKLHVLFVDISSFTTVSELLSVRYPHILSVLLNRFFTSVCDSVADTGGTVDKFIGDCVMAFWGAPNPHSFSATAALLTALAIVGCARGSASPPERSTSLSLQDVVAQLLLSEASHTSLASPPPAPCDLPRGVTPQAQGAPSDTSLSHSAAFVPRAFVSPTSTALSGHVRTPAELGLYASHTPITPSPRPVPLPSSSVGAPSAARPEKLAPLPLAPMHTPQQRRHRRPPAAVAAKSPLEMIEIAPDASTTSSSSSGVHTSSQASSSTASTPPKQPVGAPPAAHVASSVKVDVPARRNQGATVGSDLLFADGSSLAPRTMTFIGESTSSSFTAATGTGSLRPPGGAHHSGQGPRRHHRTGVAGAARSGCPNEMPEAAARALQLQLTRGGAPISAEETDGGAAAAAVGAATADVDLGALEANLLDAAQFAPIRVRIGVHGGMANVGNMGCIQRLSYTALGDAVNTASRLEGFVKRMDGPCEVICGASVLVEAHPAIIARYVGPVRLAGKHDTIEVCQVLAAAVLTAEEVQTFRVLSSGGTSTATITGDTPELSEVAANSGSSSTLRHRRGYHHHDSGAEVDCAVAAYLVECTEGRSYPAVVLGQMHSLNERIRAAQAAAAAWRGAGVVSPRYDLTPDVNRLPSRIAEAVRAARESFDELPAALKALFALEDSLTCVYTSTGAIECPQK